jgi:hypothetical protein
MKHFKNHIKIIEIQNSQLRIKPKCYISMFETHMVFSQSHDEIARFSKLNKVLDSY